MEGGEVMRKRKISDVEEENGVRDMAIAEVEGDGGDETEVTGSDEIELQIAQILDKIESFTQQVTELLDSGKNMFKELSNEFEERMIAICRERVEKWQDEIRELRMLDAMNEETNAVLLNAQVLLQNPQLDS